MTARKTKDTIELISTLSEGVNNGRLIDWTYWIHQLPTLTAAEAARLMCGLDPVLFENLQNRPNKNDPSGPCGKAEAIQRLAERQGKASATPGEWLAWSRANKINAHVGFKTAAKAKKSTSEASLVVGAVDAAPAKKKLADVADGKTETCAVFRAMTDLTADEVTIVLVGDKEESGMGANNMLEITARQETRRVPLAELDLVDRRQGHLNSQGVILWGMAMRQRTTTDDKTNSKKVERLRRALCSNLGIAGNPFPYLPDVGWKSEFKLVDNRGATAKRARRDAEIRTDSLNQLNARGRQVAARFDEFGDPIDPDADAFLSQDRDDY